MNLSDLNLDIAIEELLASSSDSVLELNEKNATYPKDHKPGMRVPKNGSACSKCKFVSEDHERCGNKFFVQWHGSHELPLPADEYCCDWFQTGDVEAYGTSEGAEKGWENRVRHAHGIDVDIFDRYKRSNPNAISVRSFMEHDPPSMVTREKLAKLFLKAKLVESDADVEISKLTPLQNTVFKDKVEGIRTEGMYHNPIDVFRYNGNQYVVDGHHRLAVLALEDKNTAPANIYELPKEMNAGGPGSGCNPEVGKCGRPEGNGEDSGDDPDYDKAETFIEAIRDWQKGSHYIRAAAKELITGNTSNVNYSKDAEKDALALLDGIRHGDTFNKSLFRGVSVKADDKDNPFLKLKTGDEFQLPMQSFSTNIGVAHAFSIGHQQGDTHVVFQVDGTSRGVDVGKAVGEGVYAENEVILNGRFKVGNVEDVHGYGPEPFHVVHVNQLGTI